MFWLGFVLGCVATVAFLIVENVIGQGNGRQYRMLARSVFHALAFTKLRSKRDQFFPSTVQRAAIWKAGIRN